MLLLHGADRPQAVAHRATFPGDLEPSAVEAHALGGMNIYKISLIEPNHVTTRDDEGRILGSVRARVPLHTQPLVAASLRENSQVPLVIEVFNPTLLAPSQETYLRASKYGAIAMEHSYRGVPIESHHFTRIASESDICGITANFTERANVAVLIARRLREISPDIKIVYGGSDALHRPDFYLTEGGGDVIVPKDAEITGPQVIDALLGVGCLDKIPGITYRDGERIQSTPGIPSHPASTERHRMDLVPLPALDLVVGQIPMWTEDHEGPLPNGVHPPLTYAEFSRGCHENCSFCATAGVRYSYASPRYVEQYLQHLKHFGVSTINLVEDNILTRILLKRGQGRFDLLETFQLLRDHGFQWCFGNGIQYSLLRRRDGTFDHEVLEAMFSNCYCVYIPLEDIPRPGSGFQYPKLFGLSPRSVTAASAEKIFRENHYILEAIAGLGVPRMTLGFILGAARESPSDILHVEESLQRLRDHLLEVSPSMEQLYMPHIWMALPGTKDYRDLCAIIDQDPARINPEYFQFAIGTCGPKWIQERLRLIESLNGKETLLDWNRGRYPHGVSRAPVSSSESTVDHCATGIPSQTSKVKPSIVCQ